MEAADGLRGGWSGHGGRMVAALPSVLQVLKQASRSNP
jgi:hypothetical protein